MSLHESTRDPRSTFLSMLSFAAALALPACAVTGPDAVGATSEDLRDCLPRLVDGGFDLDCDGIADVLTTPIDIADSVTIDLGAFEVVEDDAGDAAEADASASAGPGFASASFHGSASGSGSSSVSGSASSYVGPGGSSSASSSGSASSGSSSASDAASASFGSTGGSGATGGSASSSSSSETSTAASESFSCSRAYTFFGPAKRVSCASGDGGIECTCIEDGDLVGSCSETSRARACSLFGCCRAFF